MMVDYFVKETTANLWRNRLMTIAAILTVAVSLSLVGAAILLQQGVHNATRQWQGNVNALIWLNPVAPAPAQITADQQAVQRQLEHLPGVRSCIYRSQAYDYHEGSVLVGTVFEQSVTPDSTPASLRCRLVEASDLFAVQRQMTGVPGVQGVTGPAQAIRTMEKVVGVLQWIFYSLAGILVLSALVLILNTIRLAIFARRREVSVMKLVGATNAFIRIPFLCEGLVQGLLGAVVASGLVLLLHLVLDIVPGKNYGSVLYQARVSTPGALAVCGVVVLLGLFIGAAGSTFGIRRFLDV